MADRILEQMNELKQTDALRRELVANISTTCAHRSRPCRGTRNAAPEGLEQLSGDEQRNYLEIVLEADRQLSELVARLFDLAKLDPGRSS